MNDVELLTETEKQQLISYVFIFNVTRYNKLWRNWGNRRFQWQIVAFSYSLRRKLWKLRRFNVDIYFWIVTRIKHFSTTLPQIRHFMKISAHIFTRLSEIQKKQDLTRNLNIPKILTNLWKCRWFEVWRTYNSKGESEDKNQISCPCRIVTISLRSFAKNSEWDCNSFFICNQWHWICFCIMLHTPPITHLSFAWDRFKVKPVNFYFTTIQSHLSCIVFP